MRRDEARPGRRLRRAASTRARLRGPQSLRHQTLHPSPGSGPASGPSEPAPRGTSQEPGKDRAPQIKESWPQAHCHPKRCTWASTPPQNVRLCHSAHLNGRHLKDSRCRERLSLNAPHQPEDGSPKRTSVSTVPNVGASPAREMDPEN